jgi:hypothetical protein
MVLTLRYVPKSTFLILRIASFLQSIMSSISFSSVYEMTSQNDLVHLITMVLPSDSAALTDFFNEYGIWDLVDFRSLDEVDFKETSSNAVSESNYLYPMLVKKLISVQSWYAAQMSSFPDVFEDVDTCFLLTAASFHDWRRSQNHIRITDTPLTFDPSPVTSYEPPVVSSSTTLPAPIPTAPVPSFQRNVSSMFLIILS